jgi:hypothetical protein
VLIRTFPNELGIEYLWVTLYDQSLTEIEKHDLVEEKKLGGNILMLVQLDYCA